MVSEGWIKLHRKIQDSDWWYKEKFSRGQAWVDLLLLANHKDGIIVKHDKIIPIKRGQVGHSILDLSIRWKWSRTKVNSFLTLLQKANQIQTEKRQRVTTIISITNYEKYQQKNMEKNNEKTTRRQREDINKNVKNVKKKNIYSECVFLTPEEYKKLVEQFGVKGTAERIKSLNDYIMSKGKKYKSHYHTILMWEKKHQTEKPQQPSPNYQKAKPVDLEGISAQEFKEKRNINSLTDKIRGME